MTRMWMVRSEGGSLYDDFKEHGVVAIGWPQLANQAISGAERKELFEIYSRRTPEAKRGAAITSASQVWRFINEIEKGDEVITYSPANRLYLVGKVEGPARRQKEWDKEGMSLTRKVEWWADELPRDRLGNAKSSLGVPLTVFKVSPVTADEVRAISQGRSAQPDERSQL